MRFMRGVFYFAEDHAMMSRCGLYTAGDIWVRSMFRQNKGMRALVAPWAKVYFRAPVPVPAEGEQVAVEAVVNVGDAGVPLFGW